MLDKYLTWFKSHERLIIVAFVLVTGVWGFNRYIDASAAKAQTQAEILAATVQQDNKNVAALALQAAQAQASYQLTLDAMSKQNSALLAAIAQDNAILKKQQAADQTLPLPELAKRWESLVPMQAGDVTATSSGMQVTDAGARATVQELESVPALKKQVDEEEEMAFNANMALGKAGEANKALTGEVAGLNKELVDEKASHTADVVAAKKIARKSKLAWFKGGVVVGFIGGLVVGHYVP